MITAKRTIFAFVVVSLMVFVAGSARADWDPGDGHKMHYPQLPDPYGWDVLATYPKVLADDWLCTETGPVSDIHLWGSWEGDQPENIEEVGVAIFDNISAGEGGISYSRPGNMLWSTGFGPDQFTLRPYGDGEQGWYDPYRPYEHQRPDRSFGS